MISKSKKAVLFDFGDTLASTKPSYLGRVALAFRDAGYIISDRDLEMAYVKTDYEIHKMYILKGSITPDEYIDWFFPILCKHLLLKGDLKSMRKKIRLAFKETYHTRSVLPGTLELLDQLKEEGFKLGIISNNDGRTEEKCVEVGIRNYFDIIADSTNVGMIKPDARFFHFALNQLKLLPSDAIYIGDLYGSDVLGGINAGLDVLWMNNRGVEKLDDTQVLEVKNLKEINKHLGI